VSPLEGKFFLTKNSAETPLKVGDKVTMGDRVGYIEAMKTYNAVTSDVEGVVISIAVTNGDAVEEDDVLITIA
ncbi:MAG: acetyl-CoA carboxylase biotin carboxyl carrier protein subunit, partial [Bacteroidales bacterium]